MYSLILWKIGGRFLHENSKIGYTLSTKWGVDLYMAVQITPKKAFWKARSYRANSMSVGGRSTVADPRGRFRQFVQVYMNRESQWARGIMGKYKVQSGMAWTTLAPFCFCSALRIKKQSKYCFNFAVKRWYWTQSDIFYNKVLGSFCGEYFIF